MFNHSQGLRLPPEVLRHILEHIAWTNVRTATVLSLLCKTVNHWVDAIIYTNVHLYAPRTGQLFLRTINTSQTKNASFFAMRVKSLYICSGMHPRDVLQILSACYGADELTYWEAPSPRNTQHKFLPGSPQISANDNRTRSLSPIFLPCNGDFQGHRYESFDAPSPVPQLSSPGRHLLSPRKVSLLLNDYHFGPFKPYFNQPFFSSVTHLSIANEWQDWTSWGGISSLTMPSLTHLKVDLSVGDAPHDVRHKEWMNTITTNPDLARCNVDELDARQCPWITKMNAAANALSRILNDTMHSLKVVVLVLRHDPNPARTAKMISRLAHSKIYGEVFDLSYDPVTPTGFDPRLVFAWERQPFRYSHAHSEHERMIWRSAEAVVKGQRALSGYTVMNCDFLI
ncbi:hypothetical protein BJ165DRAFT_1533699 [Panaeolus papilionaceus]|nr:hypothetical protein BJ165DRAFT_1533699 [Panaeolus papilionaceus]